MTVTQAQAITSVRARLDETTAANWTDDDLRRWINEAVRDLARVTETVQETATVTIDSSDIAAGTQEFPLDATTLRVYRVEYQATGDTSIYPLEYQDFATLDSMWWTSKSSSTGTPLVYTMWGYAPTLKIVLYPKPSRPGTLKVYYYRVPDDLATTSTADANVVLPVPNGWEDLVFMYVEYLALRRDRDPRWQEAKALYDERLQDMITLTRRWSDQAGSMAPNGNLYPAWLVEGW